jgi:hypothetical protein
VRVRYHVHLVDATLHPFALYIYLLRSLVFPFPSTSQSHNLMVEASVSWASIASYPRAREPEILYVLSPLSFFLHLSPFLPPLAFFLILMIHNLHFNIYHLSKVTSSAAGVRTFQLLKHLVNQGNDVSFACSSRVSSHKAVWKKSSLLISFLPFVILTILITIAPSFSTSPSLPNASSLHPPVS